MGNIVFDISSGTGTTKVYVGLRGHKDTKMENILFEDVLDRACLLETF